MTQKQRKPPSQLSLTDQNTKLEKLLLRDRKADNVTQAESTALTKMQNRTTERAEERTVDETRDKSHG